MFQSPRGMPRETLLYGRESWGSHSYHPIETPHPDEDMKVRREPNGYAAKMDPEGIPELPGHSFGFSCRECVDRRTTRRDFTNATFQATCGQNYGSIGLPSATPQPFEAQPPAPQPPPPPRPRPSTPWYPALDHLAMRFGAQPSLANSLQARSFIVLERERELEEREASFQRSREEFRLQLDAIIAEENKFVKSLYEFHDIMARFRTKSLEIENRYRYPAQGNIGGDHGRLHMPRPIYASRVVDIHGMDDVRSFGPSRPVVGRRWDGL